MNAKGVFVFLLLTLILLLFLITSCASPVEKLYLEKCSKCHGENGTGKSARVDFTRQKFSEEKIRYAIEHGKGEMASIPEIQEPELTQIVNYVADFYKDN
jgi:hypothetical protein